MDELIIPIQDEVHVLLLDDIVLVDAIECEGFMLHLVQNRVYGAYV